MPGRSVLSCRHFIETCFWPDQNVLSSSTLPWNGWREMCLCSVEFVCAHAVGTFGACAPRGRGISPGSLFAHGKFFVGYSQGANSDREYFRALTERRAKPGSVSAKQPSRLAVRSREILCWVLPKSEKRSRILSRPHGGDSCNEPAVSANN